MFSISFLPWVLLMLFAVLSVPIAAKMAPETSYGGTGPGDDTGGDDMMAAGMAAMGEDDFGADPGNAEPLGDDAFADFN